MDSKKLAHFVAAIEQGSLNRAALKIRISQPALSKTIQALELELGVELIQRTSTGVKPTDYGRTLYAHAKAIMAELTEARMEIQDKVKRQISVGMVPSYGAAILVPVIARLHASKQPVPHLRFAERPAPELIPELKRGEFDFVIGIVEGAARMLGTVETLLFEDELKIVVRSGHPLAKLPSVRIKHLQSFPWIMPANRPFVENLFREAGFEMPETQLVNVPVHFVKELLPSSDYIGCMSTFTVLNELKAKQLRVLPFKLTGLKRPVGIIQREHHPLPPAARNLIRQIEQSYQLSKRTS